MIWKFFLAMAARGSEISTPTKREKGKLNITHGTAFSAADINNAICC